MDGKKDSEDLTIGLDGAMNEGAQPIVAPIAEGPAQKSEPAPQNNTENNAIPPPNDEPIVDSTPSESIQVNTTEKSEVADPESFGDGSLVAPPPLANTLTVAGDDIPNTAPKISQTNKDNNTHTVTEENQSNTSHNTKPHEHRNNKKAVAFLIILVALISVGAVVFVYVSAQENAEPSAPVIENQQPAAASETSNSTINNDVNDLNDSSDQPDSTPSDAFQTPTDPEVIPAPPQEPADNTSTDQNTQPRPAPTTSTTP